MANPSKPRSQMSEEELAQHIRDTPIPGQDAFQLDDVVIASEVDDSDGVLKAALAALGAQE